MPPTVAPLSPAVRVVADPLAGTSDRDLRSRVDELWNGVVGSNIKHGAFAMLDQALVSGTSFMGTVVVGRLAGPEELGLYSLGTTLVLLLMVTQDAIVSTPYTVFSPRLEVGNRAKYAGSVLIHQMAFGALALIGFAMAAMAMASGRDAFAPVLGVLAIATPFVLLRDFGRKFSVADLNMVSAIGLDGSVAAMQLAGLAMLGLFGWVKATNAYILMGTSSMLAALVWIGRSRQRFQIDRSNISEAWWRNWTLGRWLLASRVMAQLNSDVFLLWLLTFFLGRTSAGLFAACLTTVFFANPVILGASLIVTPKISLAFSNGGTASVRRSVKVATTCLAAGLTAFCLLVFVFGETVMRFLYGMQFAGHGTTITVLAVAISVNAVALAVSNGLVVMERPYINLRSSLVGLAVMLLIASVLMPDWQILGAAIGLLVGNTVESGLRMIAFARVTRHA